MVAAFVVITLLFCAAAARDRARGHDVDGLIRLYAMGIVAFLAAQCSAR